MKHEAILDLRDWCPEPRRGSRNLPMRFAGNRFLALGVLACGLALAGAARISWPIAEAPPQTIRIPLVQLQQITAMNVDDKSQIIVEGEKAEKQNALIPISSLPLEHARRFLLQATAAGSGYGTALRCLTQAVYYEAAFEPLEGRRAVAQVVLNRVRHPAYPKSVCGVVYQGSERRTGCQFSFTCDGALLRPPAPGAWHQAEEVARAALAGHVEASVGTATHYHADYVLPKWAFQLGKIGQLGRHIFYRFPGAWGRSSALSGSYSGFEQIPALNLAVLRERAGELPDMPVTFDNGLTVPPQQTDRHAPTDIGGRLDVSKEWRLTIPDPVAASSRYREAVDATSTEQRPQNAAVESGPDEATKL